MCTIFLHRNVSPMKKRGRVNVIEKRTYVHYLFLWGWTPGTHFLSDIISSILMQFSGKIWSNKVGAPTFGLGAPHLDILDPPLSLLKPRLHILGFQGNLICSLAVRPRELDRPSCTHMMAYAVSHHKTACESCRD